MLVYYCLSLMERKRYKQYLFEPEALRHSSQGLSPEGAERPERYREIHIVYDRDTKKRKRDKTFKAEKISSAIYRVPLYARDFFRRVYFARHRAQRK